jgi:hypothetical protein
MKMKIETITKEQIKNIIQEQYNRELADYIWFNDFMEVIKQFEGKPISKRIETALKKAFPDVTFSYDILAGMYRIFAWGQVTGRTYDNRMTFYIGNIPFGSNDNTVLINEVKIRESMTSFDTAALKRNEYRQQLLKNDTMLDEIVSAFNAFNDAKTRIDTIFEYDNHIEDEYRMDDLIPCYSKYPKK